MMYDKNWDRISNEKTLLYETKLEGLIEGEEIGLRKVATNLRKKGVPIKEISELTGLSEEEIEGL
jgi:predicted transposase/invertase (TIGR01784 family)